VEFFVLDQITWVLSVNITKRTSLNQIPFRDTLAFVPRSKNIRMISLTEVHLMSVCLKMENVAVVVNLTGNTGVRMYLCYNIIELCNLRY